MHARMHVVDMIVHVCAPAGGNRQMHIFEDAWVNASVRVRVHGCVGACEGVELGLCAGEQACTRLPSAVGIAISKISYKTDRVEGSSLSCASQSRAWTNTATMHTHTHTHTHTRTHTHTDTYTRTHVRTHAHTCAFQLPDLQTNGLVRTGERVRTCWLTRVN